jgi:putative PIN family toxin of toxin-antitoxin system
MDRIVLDTNVVVAALLSQRGASNQLLRMVSEEAPFRVCLSVPLVLEYESALRRKLGRDHPGIDPILDYLCKVGEHQEIFFLWRPYLQDPGDEMVLEVAVGSQASRIVTHNRRDFRGVEETFGVRIVSPGEYLEELEGSE